MTVPALAETVLLLAVGLCLGSFVTTAALRAARGEAFLGGRSHCDACGEGLSLVATMPVVSYVGRRGACAACGSPIDRLHPVGEILGAALLLGTFALTAPARAGLISVLGLCLLAAAIVDARTMQLPDGLTLSAAALGGSLAALRSWEALAVGVGAAILTMLVLEALRRGYQAGRGASGLGLGDVKLAGALALWLGLATPWAVGLAAVLGLVAAALLKTGRERIAFGPALAAGGLVVGLVEEALKWPA